MGEKLLNPEDLYELDTDLPEMTGPVLLHSLDGFVDAGSTGQLVREHLLEALEHRVIARFDVDSLIDYRARRPTMTFDRDHWASYDAPELVVRLLHDDVGSPFLMLSGPEPDRLWEGFTRSVLLHAARALLQILLSIVALIAFCGGLAFVLVRTLGVDPLTAYLATSPGGADSVAIIAASSDVDVPFVMAMQTGRFLIILLIGPALARFIARRSGLAENSA